MGTRFSKIFLTAITLLLLSCIFVGSVSAATETWTGTIESVTLNGGTEDSPLVITVDGTVLVSGTITVSSGYVTITGDTLKRADGNTGNLLSVSSESDAHVTLKDIVVDGGADWTDVTPNEDPMTATEPKKLIGYDPDTAKIDADGGALVAVLSGGTVTLGHGAVLQNAFASDTIGRDKDDGKAGGAVCVTNGGILLMDAGSKIWRIKSGSAVYVDTSSEFTFNGGTISHCYGFRQSGDPENCPAAARVQGDFTMKDGAVISHNYNTYIAAITITKGNHDYSITGGEIYYNVALEGTGGVRFRGDGLKLAEGLNVHHNVGGKNSGGISIRKATGWLKNCIVTDNIVRQVENDGTVTEKNIDISVGYTGTGYFENVKAGAVDIDGTNVKTYFVAENTFSSEDISGLGGTTNAKLTVYLDSSDKLTSWESFTQKAQTVFLVLNGGKAYETSGTLLDKPVKEGYTFKGWYADADFTGDSSETTPTTVGNTYYAKWELDAPTNVAITADKASITTSETAILTATADHVLDSVTYKYQWYKDSVGDTNKIGETTTPRYQVQNLGETTTYLCTVIAVNGNDESVAVPSSNTVTIIKAADPGEIVIDSKKSTANYGDAAFTFTYTTNIDEPLSVKSSNTDIATVVDNEKTVTVTICGIGSTEISVSFAGNEKYSFAKDNFTLSVSKGVSSMTITPDLASFVGEGKVNLTVKGAPEIDKVEVTYEGAIVKPNADGICTITLPNEDKIYTFTARYTGTNYDVPDSSCTVKVTKLTVTAEGLAEGNLISGAISVENKSALENAVAGYEEFNGKTKVFIEVSLVVNGQINHDRETTFIIDYSSLGINADEYDNYDFVVLHLKNDGTSEIVKSEPTDSGLKVTSKLSPFAIGYSEKPPTLPTEETSSAPQGSSVWLTEPLTPTATPTPSETVPTDIPTAQPTPTQTETSGFGVLAVLAGLGAVMAVRRR